MRGLSKAARAQVFPLLSPLPPARTGGCTARAPARAALAALRPAAMWAGGPLHVQRGRGRGGGGRPGARGGQGGCPPPPRDCKHAAAACQLTTASARPAKAFWSEHAAAGGGGGKHATPYTGPPHTPPPVYTPGPADAPGPTALSHSAPMHGIGLLGQWGGQGGCRPAAVACM